ncbi:MAG: hypothetical protein JO000_19055 [Alphaproteobacteria bacterium]|nr:hypothetical protein [Alphaproteobacteria bacterium]
MRSTTLHIASTRAQLAADREQLRALQRKLQISFEVIDRGKRAYLDSLTLLARLDGADGAIEAERP